MDQNKKRHCCTCKEHQIRPILLKLVFIFVVALGLVGCGLILRYDEFGKKVLEGAEGDSILLELSTTFNKEIVFKSRSNETRFTVYVNPGTPEISSRRYIYTSGSSFFIPSWSYQFWRLHLLKGTELDIKICADQYVMFYIIKGKRYYTEWAQTTLFDKYLFKHRVLPQKDCASKAKFKTHKLKAKETDFFYIMFSSSVGWRFFTRVSTVMFFNRTVYNTTSISQKCQKDDLVNMCVAPLKYKSHDKALIVFNPAKGETPNTFKKHKITSEPKARIFYYIVFYCGIFGCILLLTLLYTIWRCFAQKVNMKQDKFPLLSVSKRVYSNSRGATIKPPRERKITRATLGSFEVVSRNEIEPEVEEEDSEEEVNMTINEDLSTRTTYLTIDQVRDSCLTATGISAI